MPYLALLISFLVLAPSSALAADLSIKSHEGRTLFVRYEDMKGASLSVIAASGKEVRTSRLPKENGIKRIMLPKNLAAGAYTILASDRSGTKLDAETFTVSYPVPTCRITASEKSFEKGDLLRLRWNSENAESAMLFGSKKVGVHGSERVSLYHAGTRGFALSVVGKGGIAGCSVSVRVSE